MRSMVPIDGDLHGVERNALRIAASLLCPMPACVIDQHLSHRPCCRTEEIRASLPRNTRVIDETKVRFVHECCRAQRVVRPLAQQLPVRASARSSSYTSGSSRSSTGPLAGPAVSSSVVVSILADACRAHLVPAPGAVVGHGGRTSQRAQ